MSQTRVNPDSQLPDEIARLARGLPPPGAVPRTFNLYLAELALVPPELVERAVTHLIRTSDWFPTIAAIRRECAELALDLPTEELALAMIEAFGAWARLRGDEIAPAVHPLVIRAMHQVGGWIAYRLSDSPSIWRAGFTRAYRELRAAEIAAAQSDDRIAYRQIEPQ